MAGGASLSFKNLLIALTQKCSVAFGTKNSLVRWLVRDWEFPQSKESKSNMSDFEKKIHFKSICVN